MSTQTDTPETDAARQDGYTFEAEDLRPAIDFARKLERERNEARERAESKHGLWMAELKRVTALEQQLEAMREAVKEVQTDLSKLLDIINESRGVAGWHLNGNVATWDELEINPDAALAKLQPFITP